MLRLYAPFLGQRGQPDGVFSPAHWEVERSFEREVDVPAPALVIGDTGDKMTTVVTVGVTTVSSWHRSLNGV